MGNVDDDLSMFPQFINKFEQNGDLRFRKARRRLVKADDLGAALIGLHYLHHLLIRDRKMPDRHFGIDIQSEF